MQLGFVVDHTRCIGCHACTVACKAENDVPVGNFRTWVKYTEEGTFPQVRRSFAVLRCNQCTNAPCITICPVRALSKRPDGIVDIDPDACIGCKACMQGCPYDALYINDSTGTAEKCHFCAHRTERGLAPACAVVCPTEAIIPGDFHDPESVVWKLRAEGGLTARKPEAGTGPNVLYREVSAAGIDPLRTHAGGGYLWADRVPGDELRAEQFRAIDPVVNPEARTTYDVNHSAPWGARVTAYLFTKSLAAGLFLVLGLLLSPLAGPAELSSRARGALSLGSLAFLLITALLLILDLKRPERFARILFRPNWSSWLARGTVVLLAYSAVLALWTAGTLAGVTAGPATPAIYLVGAVLAVLTAAYTAWLFAQSKGRVLWMRRGLWLHLVVQSLAAGAGLALLCHAFLDLSAAQVNLLRLGLIGALALHTLFVLVEQRLAPRQREEEYRQASRLISHGPFATRRYALGLGVGIALPLAMLGTPGSPVLWAVAGSLALIGLYCEEDILIRAGQAQPIS